jgi:uncharacterized protein (DUF1697 family)
MLAFRQLLEAHGFSEVRTVLNSGNAVFRCAGRSAGDHAKAMALVCKQASASASWW